VGGGARSTRKIFEESFALHWWTTKSPFSKKKKSTLLKEIVSSPPIGVGRRAKT